MEAFVSSRNFMECPPILLVPSILLSSNSTEHSPILSIWTRLLTLEPVVFETIVKSLPTSIRIKFISFLTDSNNIKKVAQIFNDPETQDKIQPVLQRLCFIFMTDSAIPKSLKQNFTELLGRIKNFDSPPNLELWNPFFKWWLSSFFTYMAPRKNLATMAYTSTTAKEEPIINSVLNLLVAYMDSNRLNSYEFVKTNRLRSFSDSSIDNSLINHLYQEFCFIQLEFLYSLLNEYSERNERLVYANNVISHLQLPAMVSIQSELQTRIHEQAIVIQFLSKSIINMVSNPGFLKYIMRLYYHNPSSVTREYDYSLIESLSRIISVLPKEKFNDLPDYLIHEFNRVNSQIISNPEIWKKPYSIIYYVSLARKIYNRIPIEPHVLNSLMQIAIRISNDEIDIINYDKVIIYRFINEIFLQYKSDSDLPNLYQYLLVNFSNINSDIDDINRYNNEWIHAFIPTSSSLVREWLVKTSFSYHDILIEIQSMVNIIQKNMTTIENDSILKQKCSDTISNLLVNSIKNKFLTVNDNKLLPLTQNNKYDVSLKILEILSKISNPTLLSVFTDKTINLISGNSTTIPLKILQIQEEFETSSTEETELEYPDEFLDPLILTPMMNPYYLPTSKVIIDKSSIMNHLLYHSNDPFNRDELTLEKLETFQSTHEAIAKISEFKDKMKTWKESQCSK